MPLRTHIIPAAGLGKRRVPLTGTMPGELLTVHDRPMLPCAMEEAAATGVGRVIIVIRPDKLAIRDDPQRDNASRGRAGAVIACQDKPAGLGDAVACARDLVLPGPVGVILPDDVIMGAPCLRQMTQDCTVGHMVAAKTVNPEDALCCGIFPLSGAEQGRAILAAGMVEKPGAGTKPSLPAALERHILDLRLSATPARTPLDAGREVQVTVAIAGDAQVTPLTASRCVGQRFDAGSHEGLPAAAQTRRRRVLPPPCARAPLRDGPARATPTCRIGAGIAAP
jgi:UTP--glucose-1-phosphate uridylyltransferase